MVWVLLAVGAVSWVVVSSIRVGQGNTANIPLTGRDGTDEALAPTPSQILRTAQRRAGAWAMRLGPQLARDWPVARSVAIDGLHAVERVALRVRRAAAERPEVRRRTESAVRPTKRLVSTMPRRTPRRRRSIVAGPATWYEVKEQPWRTRIAAVIELVMLVSVVGIAVAGAVAAAGVTVVQLVR
jgi:hypothetical protein